MLSPWLNARKYEWLAPHAIRGATSAKQTAWLKMGRDLTVRFRTKYSVSRRLFSVNIHPSGVRR